MLKEKKVFVLDTNVILHNFNCIYNFDEHDVIILTTVLEELDRFKKGNETMNVNVREFHRILDKFAGNMIKITTGKGASAKEKKVSALFYGGVDLGPDLGKIQIKTSNKILPTIKGMFCEMTPDHRILSAVFNIEDEEKKGQKRRVILVTKDVNLRLKATGLGIEVEDYQHDKVPSVDHLYTGKGEITGDEIAEVIKQVYDGPVSMYEKPYSHLIPQNVQPNMYFTLQDKKKSALVYVDKKKEKFTCIQKITVFGITPRNAEQTFAIDALMRKDLSLVSLLGKAGTGKTLLAMAASLQQLLDAAYDKIIIAAAMIPLSNRDIGALPGDANEKVLPYMQGLYDNLEFIKSQYKSKKVQVSIEESEEMLSFSKKRKNRAKPQTKPQAEEKDFVSLALKEGKIKIQPLASIRGRSFNNTIFIIDEAQNLTPHEVKTIVTRAGENTKVIFCGDVQQIDSPYLDPRSNGLSHLIYRMAGNDVVAHITLEKGERSHLAELAADLL